MPPRKSTRYAPAARPARFALRGRAAFAAKVYRSRIARGMTHLTASNIKMWTGAAGGMRFADRSNR
ncbi:hypothetical protein AQ798_03855 [Burkholderia pseudomallei]|nr:hypothetical protein AQ798_03855 [Burkholderia pseudomallei]